MKALLLICALSSLPLIAKPYHSENTDGYCRTLFSSSNINDEDEPQVRVLQAKYLRAGCRSERRLYEWQLNSLGVKVNIIPESYPGVEVQGAPYFAPPNQSRIQQLPSPQQPQTQQQPQEQQSPMPTPH
jgi:hypothetical protein